MEVTIDGNKYKIDIEKAKQLGLCKQVYKEITDFSVGDIFRRPTCGTKLMIVQALYRSYTNRHYNIAGFSGLELYSDFGEETKSKNELLRWLNEREYIFVKNINDEIIKLINDA